MKITNKDEQDIVLCSCDDDDIIVCRCEEVTLQEIRDAIRAGATTSNSVKRRTRAGMGHCQSRSCSKHVARIISEELNKPPSEVVEITARPPLVPTTVNSLNTFKKKNP